MHIEDPPFYSSDVEDYIDIPCEDDCCEIEDLRYSCKRKLAEIEDLDEQRFKFSQVIEDIDHKKLLCHSYRFDLLQQIKRMKYES